MVNSNPVVRTLRRVAAATPPGRDRYLDLLRLLSILVVVFGHWLIAGITWRGGETTNTSILTVVPPLQYVTWLLMVMPVFFLVSGAVTAPGLDRAARRGTIYAVWLHGRLARLLRPVGVYTLFWLFLPVVVLLAGAPRGLIVPIADQMSRLFWFVAVYVAAIAVAPLLLRLHRRFGLGVLAVLALGALAVDLVRFGTDVSQVGVANHAFTWLFAFQLGFFWADGRLLARRGTAWLLAGGGLLTLLLLTGSGLYPVAMIGVPDFQSNVTPTSFALVPLTVWLTGLVLLLRDPVTRLLQRPLLWGAIALVSLLAITIFLWHPTAVILGVGVFYPLGFPQPDVGTALWWLLRPLWFALLTLPLLLLVRVFGRFELNAAVRPPASAPAGGTPAGATVGVETSALHAGHTAGVATALTGSALTVFSLAALTAAGFGTLLPALVYTAAGALGMLLLHRAARLSPSRGRPSDGAAHMSS